MGNKLLEFRRRMFKVYAANLSLYRREIRDLFACPICLNLFEPSSVEPNTLAVNAAHVYPEAMGCDVMTLACVECNSRIGAKYESHLVRQHRQNAAFDGSGKEEVAARLHFEGGQRSMGVTLQKAGDQFLVYVVQRQTNPADLAAFRPSGEQFRFQLRFPSADARRQNVTLLQSAYLALFRFCGYEYVLYSDTQWLRDILLSDTPPDKCPYMRLEITRDDSGALTRLFSPCYVGVDRRLLCLGIPLPTTRPDCKGMMMLLPGFGPDGAEMFAELSKTPELISEDKLDFAPVKPEPDPETRLADSKYAGIGHTAWRQLKRQLETL